MPDSPRPDRPPMLAAILRDTHFWAPFAVLLIGLALLAMLS